MEQENSCNNRTWSDNLVDPTNGQSAICDRCDSGEIQDAKNVFTRCNAFAELRWEIFEKYEPLLAAIFTNLFEDI